MCLLPILNTLKIQITNVNILLKNKTIWILNIKYIIIYIEWIFNILIN